MSEESTGPALTRVQAHVRAGVTAALPFLRRTMRMIGTAARAMWRVAGPVLARILEIVLALLIVFEEWGWRPLADLLGRLATWRPWARLETAIARLPPYVALIVFALPSTILLPLKFLALFLVARGQIVLAGLLFVAAKIVATALVARLFMLTQPALMQIGWFAWGYDIVMPWKEALTEYVRASWAWRAGRVVKERARRAVRGQWRAWRPTALELKRRLVMQMENAHLATRRWFRELRERWPAPR
jgi:hypothetical protein